MSPTTNPTEPAAAAVLSAIDVAWLVIGAAVTLALAGLLTYWTVQEWRAAARSRSQI